MTVTVVLVDLAGYSDIQRQLEQALDVSAALAFDAQIQGFIETALTQAGGTGGDNILARTGDGALLKFDTPAPALDFAGHLQALAAAHNGGVSEALARRSFRIGVATGEIAFSAETGAPSGMTITRAARLEAMADPGGILIDQASHAGAEADRRDAYAGPEIVSGKREERFTAWRRQIDTTALPPLAAPPAAPTRSELLDQIDRDFKRLRPVEVDALLRRLDIDQDRRPPDTLNAERRKSDTLAWADEESQLPRLARELRAMVGAPPQ